jgi:hypothetical protein
VVRPAGRVAAPSARGERVNDRIDWDNVAEEIESVGGRQLSNSN